MEKPSKSFWQIWNMSFAFFGIQFGWGLQMANMSAIYEHLGAPADQIPILWLDAPLTGLLESVLLGVRWLGVIVYMLTKIMVSPCKWDVASKARRILAQPERKLTHRFGPARFKSGGGWAGLPSVPCR